MTGTPSVSILVPTYNSAPFLRPALDSAVQQEHEDLQVIVVDNASTDDTVEIVREYQRDDPRVVLHRNERNIGPVANFHRCFELAEGEFVKYLMSDDVLRTDAVRRLVEPMRADSCITLATSRRQRIDATGEPIADEAATAGLGDEDHTIPGRELANLLVERCTNLVGEPTTTLFRRDAVGAGQLFCYHGYRPRVIADVALWMTLLEAGSCAWVADTLSSFRSHPGQDQRRPGLSVKGHYEWARLRRVAIRHGLLDYSAQRRRGLTGSAALLPFHAAAWAHDRARSPRREQAGSA